MLSVRYNVYGKRGQTVTPSEWLQAKGETFTLLAPVVQKVDNANHWINLYPVDKVIGFPDTYPLDSDLSGG